jgi:hypothetical protein
MLLLLLKAIKKDKGFIWLKRELFRAGRKRKIL